MATTCAHHQLLQGHRDKASMSKMSNSKGVSLEEVRALMPIKDNPAVPDQVTNVVIKEQAHLMI